jgi:hypothetical protein
MPLLARAAVTSCRINVVRMVFSAIAVTVLTLSFSQGANADTRGSLPPASGSLKMTKAVAMYTASTLEALLDGEAEALRRYNVKECAHAEYGPNGQGNQLMTADVFQFGTADQSYGYYSSQRSPNSKFLKIGAEGYQEATALNFWKGPYYVRLAITASNKAPFQAEMPKLAASIAAKLSGTTAVPDIVKSLPPGYTPHSEQYRLADIAAQSYIRNGMVAKYPAAGQQAEMFVAQFPGASAAQDAYTKYTAYLTKASNVAVGGKVTNLSGVGQKAISLKTKFTGIVIAAVKGSTLIGIRYVEDKPTVQQAATGLVKAAAAKAK